MFQPLWKNPKGGKNTLIGVEQVRSVAVIPNAVLLSESFPSCLLWAEVSFWECR